MAQVQLYSAWGRQAIAQAKQELGDQWEPQLIALAQDIQAPVADRARALDLLQLFGPPARLEVLVKLSADPYLDVRAKAVDQLGLRPEPASMDRLVEVLDDPVPVVRRQAYEALARMVAKPPVEKLLWGLNDPDHWVAWAACRAIERLPVDVWQARVLSSDQPRVFLMGSVGLLTMNPDADRCRAILDTASAWLIKNRLSVDELVSLVRVVELALDRGGLPADTAGKLRSQLAALYPATDWRLNRELVSVLVYLQEPALAQRLVAQLAADLPLPEKIHIIMNASFLTVGWTPELRGAVLAATEKARAEPGGNSYPGYLTNAATALLKHAADAERLALCAGSPGTGGDAGVGAASRRTAHARTVGRAPPARCGTGRRQVGRRPATGQGGADRPGARRRRYGRVFAAAVRNVARARAEIAAAIGAAAPSSPARAEDWPLLVRSLSVVDGPAAAEVLRTLRAPRQDVKPADLRAVILLGLKLQNGGGREAAQLLTHWTDHKPPENEAAPPVAMAAWQAWFAQMYPDLPEATLPVDAAGNKWTFAQLLDFLGSDAGRAGNVERRRRRVREGPVHQVPPLRPARRRDRSRLDQRQQSIPAEGNSGVGIVSVANHLRPVRRQDRGHAGWPHVHGPGRPGGGRPGGAAIQRRKGDRCQGQRRRSRAEQEVGHARGPVEHAVVGRNRRFVRILRKTAGGPVSGRQPGEPSRGVGRKWHSPTADYG